MEKPKSVWKIYYNFGVIENNNNNSSIDDNGTVGMIFA